MVRLRSGNHDAAMRVLTRPEGLTAALVPHVIPLLASPSLADYALFALRKVAEERVGELTDALLDPNQDDAVRRRLARVFSRCVAAGGRRPVAGARRPAVRRQVPDGALARRDRRPQPARPGRSRSGFSQWSSTRSTVSQPVWESRRLLDGFVSASPLDAYVRDRAGQSLAHVFTLLSLVPPATAAADRVPQPAHRRCDLRARRSSISKSVLPTDIRQSAVALPRPHPRPSCRSRREPKRLPGSCGRAARSRCGTPPTGATPARLRDSPSIDALSDSPTDMEHTSRRADRVRRPAGIGAKENVMSRKSPLDRALSLFTDIRAGEGGTAVLMLRQHLPAAHLLLGHQDRARAADSARRRRRGAVVCGGGAGAGADGVRPALQLVGGARGPRPAARRRLAVLHRLHRAVRGGGGRARAVSSASRSSSGSASSTCRSSRSSGRSPTTSTARKPATGCSRSSSIGMTAGAPLGSLVAGRLFHSGVTPAGHSADRRPCCWRSASRSTCWINRRERGQRARAGAAARRPPAASAWCSRNPLPAADRRAGRPAQRRQHDRRVPRGASC